MNIGVPIARKLLPEPPASPASELPQLASHLPPVDDAPLHKLLVRTARVLTVLLVAAGVNTLFAGSRGPALILAIGSVGFGALGWRAKAMPTPTRAIWLTGGLTALISLLILLSGEGIRDAAVLAYPAILVLASLTVSSTRFLAVTVAVIITALGLAMLEFHGFRHTVFLHPITRPHMVDLLLTLIGTAVLSRLLAHHLLGSLHRAHWQSLIDSLTGLPNRRALTCRADGFLAEARAQGLLTSVVALHIDRLNHINNTFGQAVGDAALTEIGKRFATLITPDCFIARNSGNSLVVMIRSAPGGDTARETALQMIDLSRAPQTASGIELRLDATGGLRADDSSQPSAKTLIEESFIALDLARDEGGGLCLAYEPAFGTFVRGEFALESAVRHAIDTGVVTMHYQPILAQPGQQVIAFEALLRLRDRAGQPIPTLPAVQLAEATGLIHRLSDVSLLAVLRDIKAWRSQGMPDIPVSVNFSGLQLSRPDFATGLLDTLRAHQLPGTALIVEITETAAISGDEHLAANLDQLAAAGVMIALDDFGAGHSSLTRLRELQAQIIKFDAALIRDIGTSESARRFLQKTIELVNVAYPFVLLEGIETEAQAAQAEAIGCNALQGYRYARPMSAEAVTAYLKTQGAPEPLKLSAS